MASNVRWNTFEDIYCYTSPSIEGQGFTICMYKAGLSNLVDWFVQCTKVSDEYYDYFQVKFILNENVSENIMASKIGDEVSASTIRNLDDDRYLIHNNIDDGRHDTGKATLTVLPSNIYYIAFVCEGLYDEIAYGWVAYDINNSGEFELLAFAYDSDGGPMIVGGGSAIPEPSAGLLLLLGCSLLALRRRKSARVCLTPI